MMQQINLYQPIFRKEEKIFSAKTLLIGNLLVLIGIGMLYGATLWQGESLQSQLTQTMNQRDENRDRITKLSAQYPQKKRNPQLAINIANARARLAFLREVSLTLSAQENGIERGFSEHLAGLSRQDIPKLWLNKISILRGGSDIKLNGSTTVSERVPYYIQQLSLEDVFQGTSFHRLSISADQDDKRPEQQPAVIKFTLETALKPISDKTATSPVRYRKLGSQRFSLKSPGEILDEKVH